MFERKFEKAEAMIYAGEENGGSEIVQTVIILGFALGLGVALILLQGTLGNVLENSGTKLTEFFGNITKNMTK